MLILGVIVTLTISTLLSFSMFRYGLSGTPWIFVYLILFVPSAPGITLSLYYYMKGSFHKGEKPEIPLVSEEKIFQDLNNDKPKADPPHVEPFEPEVIRPSRAIVPYTQPGEAIKTVMQNKVIEALQKCKVEVNINADMDLNGEFKDPKISVAFLTPKAKKEDPEEKSGQEQSSEESNDDMLEKPRI